LPYDKIIKINNETIKGLDKFGVIDRLRGKPGESVIITLTRNNQELEFNLNRAKLFMSSSQRQTELIDAISFFIDVLKQSRQMSNDNLNKLQELAKGIADGKQEPVSALLSIPNSIENQIIQYKKKTNDVIAKGKKVFIEQNEAIKELEIILSYLQNIQERKVVNIRDADESEKRMLQLIENDKRLSQEEKTLFNGYFMDLGIRTAFPFYLELEKKAIEKRDVKAAFEENKKRALEMTEHLTKRLEMHRTRLAKDMDRIQATDEGLPFFGDAVKFLISINKEAALVTSEKSRARAFADMLAKKYPKESSLDEHDALMKEFEQLSSNNNPSDSESNRLQEVINKLSLISSGSALPINLEILKEIINQNNSIIIEYFLTEDQIIIWVIMPKGDIKTVEHHIPIKNLQEDIERLYNYINEEGLGKEKQKQLSNLLQQLYIQLIKPIENILPDNSEEVITIIPHQELLKIPFAALKDNNGKYLIEKYPIAYAPSIAVLKYTHENKQHIINKDNPNLLAFVNPKPMPASLNTKTNNKPLTPLDFTEKYFGKISSFYTNKNIFVSTDATEENLLKEAHQYTVLYFATHSEAVEDSNEAVIQNKIKRRTI